MKALNVILGVLVLAAAMLAAPAMLASVVAGAAGLLMVASAGPSPAPVPQVQTVQIVRTVQVPPPSMSLSWTAGRVLWCFAR